VPTAFALERKAKDRTNINAFAKLETQQCWEDRPSNMTSFRGPPRHSEAPICLELVFEVVTIDTASDVGRNFTQNSHLNEVRAISAPKLQQYYEK
jgi:hypothetical protein